MTKDTKFGKSVGSPGDRKDVTRREFMDKAAALGVSTAVIAGTGASMFPAEAQASTPKRGGHLRVGVASGNSSDSFDPHLKSGEFTNLTRKAFRNCLGEVDHTGALVPELAESWEAAGSASRWKFNLRKGLTFHDGKTLDIDDVMQTINYHRRKGSKSSSAKFARTITDMKKDGTHSVIMELEGPNANFPFIAGSFEIMSFNKAGEPYDFNNGTGSYIMKEFKPGQRARLERDPNHWREGVGWFDSIELTPILDIAARQNALLTNEVDVISRPSPKTFPRLKQAKGIETAQATGKLHRAWPMQIDQAPFNNIDVRQALRHAVNREEILAKVLNGGGSLGNDHPIARADQYYNPNIPQRPYDPEKSKFLLKKAGMSDLKVTLHTSEHLWAGALDAALLYSEHAKKAGIELTIKKVPSDGYWSHTWRKVPWSSSYWNAGPTADHILTRAYGADAPWNETKWQHPRFNELLEAARGELDFDKAREMYWEMQEIIHHEGSTVISVFADELYAYSDKLGHGTIAADWEMDGFHLLERWWFK